MEPARELAQLLVRGVELDERPLEVLLGRLGSSSSSRMPEVDGVGDADEVLLGAVVEVPLEPLPLGVARGDDARPRAPDLLLDLLPRGHVEPAEEVAQPVVGVVHDGRRPVDDEPLAVGRDVLVLDDAAAGRRSGVARSPPGREGRPRWR